MFMIFSLEDMGAMVRGGKFKVLVNNGIINLLKFITCENGPTIINTRFNITDIILYRIVELHFLPKLNSRIIVLGLKEVVVEMHSEKKQVGNS